jgi:hypothetical protein
LNLYCCHFLAHWLVVVNSFRFTGHQWLLEQGCGLAFRPYVLVYSNPDPATTDAENPAWIR